MTTAFIAIDPGLSGGMAFNLNGGAWANPMDKTEGDILEQIRTFKEGCRISIEEPVAYLESIVMFAGKNTPSSAIAKYAENFGFVKGCLMSLEIPLHLVQPKEWQKAMGLGTSRGLTKSQWKNRAKQKAQELFPSVKVTLATADALCLLAYARGNSAKREAA